MIVERPDLSQRTALSKSVLTQFDLCASKVWYGLHDPRPFVPNEKVTFGSAVDAGVEIIVKLLASDQPVTLDRAFAAAAEIVERDQVELVFSDVEHAIEKFPDAVQGIDWRLAVTQAHLTATLEELGECDGHPDIILGNNAIFDVKTSGRAKEVPSLELGFYVLLAEEVDPTRKVPSVGYFNWVRSKKPFWQVVETPVTDELRRWAYEKSASYVRAKKADEALNRNGTARNFSMVGGPSFAGLCRDCPYNPSMGGPCLISLQGEEVTLDA